MSRPVLNGGDEETGLVRPRLVATQLECGDFYYAPIAGTHRGQQVTPALTLPQVRYGLSVLLMEVLCTLTVASMCRRVYR
jgi:hypothetical protein